MTSLGAATLWRRRRSRRLIVQAGFGLGVGLVLLYLVSRAARLELGLGFMSDRAGFAISHQWLTSYTGSESRSNAYAVGVFNTVRLVISGLVLATLLGLVAGVARLSRNWLVARLATVYVEVFRNTPLLIQIIFWYTAVLLQLPNLERGIDVFEIGFLSNRALAVPWAYPEGAFVAWLVIVAFAAVAAWAAHRWRLAIEERTGRAAKPGMTALAVFVGIVAIGFVATGTPLRPELPEQGTAGAGIPTITGGMQVTPEFAALLLALVIYTGAFIAEIVRGSIQALPRGQTEAAMAVGLGAYERMTLVILPQALRIMIPPLTNQYLNLTKNSSLAVAIAYPDLVFVGRTIQNNAGHAVPVFLAIMATYLVMSFAISVLMNALNRRVQRVGR